LLRIPAIHRRSLQSQNNQHNQALRLAPPIADL
jgi:hypothetical protein